MAHAFWHVWGPQWPKQTVPETLPRKVPADQLFESDPMVPIPNYPADEWPPKPAVPEPLTQTSGTGPAFKKGFWQRHGESQMDPRTIKILRDREEALAAEGAAIEAQRKENERNRMLAATRYVDPELESSMRQGTVAKDYAPPEEDDDWFKKMMQYSFMQSMMPERDKYTGTSNVRAGGKQRPFVDIPYYTSPFPGGTV